MEQFIKIWTDEPIRESDPTTTLRVEGHPRIEGLVAPSAQLKGWNGYMLTIWGVVVPAPPGPSDEWPGWQFELGGEQDGLTLTVRAHAQAAYRPGLRLSAMVRWSAKRGLVKSLEVLSDDWDKNDLKRAAYALKRLHGRVRQRGRDEGDGSRWLSDAEALRDIDAQILKGKQGATAVGMALGVDRSTIYRRVKNGAHMRLSEYVAYVISRDLAQH